MGHQFCNYGLVVAVGEFQCVVRSSQWRGKFLLTLQETEIEKQTLSLANKIYVTWYLIPCLSAIKGTYIKMYNNNFPSIIV